MFKRDPMIDADDARPLSRQRSSTCTYQTGYLICLIRRDQLVTNKFSKIAILYLLNVVLLTYSAWTKYNSSCPSCNQVSFLKIDSIYIAMLGIMASLVLSVIVIFISRYKILKYLIVILAFTCTSFAIYLQIAQFFVSRSLCYLCLSATSIFYVAFCAIAFEVIVRPRLSITKGSATLPISTQKNASNKTGAFN